LGLAYSRAVRWSSPPDGERSNTWLRREPTRATDGAALCSPAVVQVNCACGRIQRVHHHSAMAYANACMDCLPGPTGIGGCPEGCFSLN
jgi:hypothetical protein